MTRHYPDVGSASNWSKRSSLAFQPIKVSSSREVNCFLRLIELLQRPFFKQDNFPSLNNFFIWTLGRCLSIVSPVFSGFATVKQTLTGLVRFVKDFIDPHSFALTKSPLRVFPLRYDMKGGSLKIYLRFCWFCIRCHFPLFILCRLRKAGCFLGSFFAGKVKTIKKK